MKRLVIVPVLALALGLFVAPVSAEHEDQGLAEHCPNHQGHPGKVESTATILVNGIEVQVVINGPNVSFFDGDGNPIVVEFCIKAGPLAGGVTTGSSGTVTWVNHGGQIPDISYVVVYSVVRPPPPPPPPPPDEVPPDEVPPDEVPPDEVPPDEVPPDEVPPEKKVVQVEAPAAAPAVVVQPTVTG